MLFEPYVRFRVLFKFGNRVAAYLEIAAHSACDMFIKYKYLFVNLGFSNLGFWRGNFFLIAPFPEYCLLVPF